MKIVIVVPGNPLPKARPRFGCGRAYTPPATRAWEEWVGWHVRHVLDKPLVGRLAVTLRFYRSNRRRVDLDNLIKAALDAVTGIAWRDDSQVITLDAQLLTDRDNPRLEIEIDGYDEVG